jgi:polyhydroxyalkanoate synthesis regulator phasin
LDIAWQRYIDLITGFAQMTQKRTEQVVRELVRWGEVEANKSEQAVEDLIDRVEQNRKTIVSFVRRQLAARASQLGLARQSDIDRLQAEIVRLETTIHNLEGIPVNRGIEESPPKSSAAEETEAAQASGEIGPVGDEVS